MIYVPYTPNPSGAYPNAMTRRFPNSVALTDKQAQTFYAYNGFVNIECAEGDDGLIAASVTPNTEAWEQWTASHPAGEQEPTELEQLRADVDYISVMTGVEL